MSLVHSSAQHCAVTVSGLGETTSCFHGNLGRADREKGKYRELDQQKRYMIAFQCVYVCYSVHVCAECTYVGVDD